MTPVKTMITVAQLEEDGALYGFDTIEHNGKLWIAPLWHQGPEPGTEIPDRLICLAGLPIVPSQTPGADFHLQGVWKRSVLEGREAGKTLVLLRPDGVCRISQSAKRP